MSDELYLTAYRFVKLDKSVDTSLKGINEPISEISIKIQEQRDLEKYGDKDHKFKEEFKKLLNDAGRKMAERWVEYYCVGATAERERLAEANSFKRTNKPGGSRQ